MSISCQKLVIPAPATVRQFVDKDARNAYSPNDFPQEAAMNRLCYGDCLNVLRTLDDACVDLIYLDPPFNSQRDYNAFFASKSGKEAQAQILAFEDTWHWGEQAQREFSDLLANPGSGALGEKLLPALREFLGNSDMMAYLTVNNPALKGGAL